MRRSGLRLWLSINGPKWLAEEVAKKKEEAKRFRSVSMGRGLKTVKLKKETNAFVGRSWEVSH
jgi:hypothetical protein